MVEEKYMYWKLRYLDHPYSIPNELKRSGEIVDNLV